MTKRTSTSRFAVLAQAVRDSDQPPVEPVADAADTPQGESTSGNRSRHNPAIAMTAMAETLRERISRLEAELGASTTENSQLKREIDQARFLERQAGPAASEFVFLAPDAIRDSLPRDRLPSAMQGSEFGALLRDIETNGQNDPITVRPAPRQPGRYEIAAGRRRLEVCRSLGRPVLARVRADLGDDDAMLRIQWTENERREDISALERARWFAAVEQLLRIEKKDLAARFGLDPSTLSLYLRLSRFPSEIADRLPNPRRLSILRARRVMEAIETDPSALMRICDALDASRAAADAIGTADPDDQIDTMLQAAEGVRAGAAPQQRPRSSDRRIVQKHGRQIGTLTRSGKQWIFRFVSTIDESVIFEAAEKLGDLVVQEEALTKRKNGN